MRTRRRCRVGGWTQAGAERASRLSELEGELLAATAEALEALETSAAKGLLEDGMAALMEDRVALAALACLRIHRIVAIVEALSQLCRPSG